MTTCDQPISPGVACHRPGDHTGGCEPAPPRCLCSHSRSLHGRGTGQCYSAACGCSRMRLPEPAISVRFDERYDPSPEPIDRSIQ